MSIHPDRDLLFGALKPTLLVGVISVIASVAVYGKSGFGGALLAQLVVVIYFSAHLLVSRVSRNLDPMTTMSLAMFSYFAKFILFGAFLWIITRYVSESICNHKAFGLSAIALTFAWLGGEIASYLKLKLHLQLPNE